MASNGSFLSSGWYSSSKGDYIYLEFAWSVTNTSIAENYKDIYWELRGKRTASGYVKSGGFQVVIDGETVYDKGEDYRIELRNGTVVASGTKRLLHKEDGNRSFDVSIAGAIYFDARNVSGSTTFDLDTIPRKATIESAPDFTDLDDPTITFNNPAGDAVTSLRACIDFDSVISIYPYEGVDIPSGRHTFWLSEEQRNIIRENTVTSRTVGFHLETVIGGNRFYHSVYKTVTLAESDATKPVVTINKVEPVSVLGEPFKSMYIQGKSKVDADLSWYGKYGASVLAYWIEVEGKNYSYPFETAPLSMSGAQKVKAIVRDSRGFYGYDETKIDVIEYSKPLVVPISSANAIQCYRSDGNGNRISNSTSLWIKAKQSYYKLQGKNNCALQWRWKESTEQWNDSKHQWNDLIPRTNTTKYEYNSSVSGVFELKKSYTVQIRAIDDLGEYDIKTIDIPTDDVALHLGKGGKNVTVGSYCDYSKEHTFRSAWEAIFDKSINGVYIRTVEVTGGTEIRLQTSFEAWDAAGSRRQSFLVFGSANAVLVHGVCIVHNTGSIKANSITNCEVSCEEAGVVKITLPGKSWDQFTVISARPFTIIQGG